MPGDARSTSNGLAHVPPLGWALDLNGAVRARSRSAEAHAKATAARVAATRQATRATAARLYIAWREALARAAAGLVAPLDHVSLAAELLAAEARLETELVAARADHARAHIPVSSAMGLGAL